ncbi:MAG: DUF697 domain-containing protein [Geobacter sp.]|nr:DUF697 domain-containing protein [Geobacter sp.]
MTDKEQQATDKLKKYMWLAMGAGLIPCAWLDLAAVGGVQIKVLAEISKIYGIPFEKSYGKAAISALITYTMPHVFAFSIIGSFIKTIPIVGALAGAPMQSMLCAAFTWATGQVFIQHFESGGTFLDFDSEQVKEYFKTQFEEGRKQAAAMRKDGEPSKPA